MGVYPPFTIKHVSLFPLPFCYCGLDKVVAAILAAANRKTSVFCLSVGVLGMADPAPRDWCVHIFKLGIACLGKECGANGGVGRWPAFIFISLEQSGQNT